jgi:energy-coupling factor transporter ATP-binding protein EcfA2
MAALDQVMIRLHRALEAGALPPEGRKLGQRLMSQLHQPTRIAVLGLTGAGKTSLVNMLLGANLMPDLGGLSTTELSFGDRPRFQITLLDGTIAIYEGVLDPSRLSAETMRVSIQLPDQRLKEWSFAEIGLSPSGSGQRQILDWMADRSDIAIWCTQQFDDRERALWSRAPEHLKDHSFLALTRADRLYMRGELADRIGQLQPIVADEFLCLYPVATLQATAARRIEGGQDDKLWKSSGGKAFFDGIRQQVDQAKTADLDHAYMLLQRYKVELPDQTPEPDILAAAAKAPAGPVAAKVPQPQVTERLSSTEGVIEAALEVLRDCAEELMATSDAAGGAVTERILDRCSKTAEDLVQLLSRTDDPSDELADLREDAIEGEQMIMLLRLERGESAAEDSMTVLLQLKKEMSERVAK